MKMGPLQTRRWGEPPTGRFALANFGSRQIVPLASASFLAQMQAAAGSATVRLLFDGFAGLFDATTGGSPSSVNSAVARWEDLASGMHLTQATTSARPTLRAGGFLEFDNVDDSMSSLSHSLLSGVGDYWWMLAFADQGVPAAPFELVRPQGANLRGIRLAGTNVQCKAVRLDADAQQNLNSPGLTGTSGVLVIRVNVDGSAVGSGRADWNTVSATLAAMALGSAQGVSSISAAPVSFPATTQVPRRIYAFVGGVGALSQSAGQSMVNLLRTRYGI